MSPVESRVSPFDSHVSPIDSHVSPIDSYVSPIDSCVSSIDSCVSSIDSYLSPIDSYLSPIDSYLSPIDSHVSLLSSRPSPAESSPLLPASSPSSNDSRHSWADTRLSAIDFVTSTDTPHPSPTDALGSGIACPRFAGASRPGRTPSPPARNDRSRGGPDPSPSRIAAHASGTDRPVVRDDEPRVGSVQRRQGDPRRRSGPTDRTAIQSVERRAPRSRNPMAPRDEARLTRDRHLPHGDSTTTRLHLAAGLGPAKNSRHDPLYPISVTERGFWGRCYIAYGASSGF